MTRTAIWIARPATNKRDQERLHFMAVWIANMILYESF